MREISVDLIEKTAYELILEANTCIGSDIGRAVQNACQNEPSPAGRAVLRQLLDNYQLYFVASAPADSSYYAETNQWLYDYVNVPAWGHTVFTNQRELLYGDYMISTDEDWTGMANQLRFGSDTFKTWDDIADYYSRLGGQ